MPIFSYICNGPSRQPKAPADQDQLKCLNEFEVFYQNQAAVAREEASEACPLCGSTDKERLVSTGTSHILKGPGWFRDGY